MLARLDTNSKLQVNVGMGCTHCHRAIAARPAAGAALLDWSISCWHPPETARAVAQGRRHYVRAVDTACCRRNLMSRSTGAVAPRVVAWPAPAHAPQ